MIAGDPGQVSRGHILPPNLSLLSAHADQAESKASMRHFSVVEKAQPIGSPGGTHAPLTSSQAAWSSTI